MIKQPTTVSFEVFQESQRENERLRRNVKHKNQRIGYLEARLDDAMRDAANSEQRSARREAEKAFQEEIMR